MKLTPDRLLGSAVIVKVMPVLTAIIAKNHIVSLITRLLKVAMAGNELSIQATVHTVERAALAVYDDKLLTRTLSNLEGVILVGGSDRARTGVRGVYVTPLLNFYRPGQQILLHTNGTVEPRLWVRDPETCSAREVSMLVGSHPSERLPLMDERYLDAYRPYF